MEHEKSPMESSRPAAAADPICARCQQPKSTHLYVTGDVISSLFQPAVWICPTATFQETK